MKHIRKSVSMPEDELITLDKAQERIFKHADYPIVNESEVFRIGLKAILKLNKGQLVDCVKSTPTSTPGRKPQKERESWNEHQIAEFFGLTK